MTWAVFDEWSLRSRRGFARQQVLSGLAAEPEATAYADRVFADLLPGALVTPGHLLWSVHLGDGPTVGHLWVRLRELPTEVEAYVMDVEIIEEARGTGLGRATMRTVEGVVRDLGATVVRLNVFGHNVPAVRLYERLGYTVAAATLTERLRPSGAVAAGAVAAGAVAAGADGALRVELRDVTAAEYDGVRVDLQGGYARELSRSGVLPVVEAARKAAADLERLRPGGPADGHRLWTAYAGPVPVGRVGVVLERRSDGLHAVGYPFGVHLEGGLPGRVSAVLRALEQACRDLGASTLSVPVLGYETDARAVYERSGFVLTAQTMVKPL
jgi:GNAT superfamily N-acetyltransferase